MDLQHRLDVRGVDVWWPDLMRNLAQVQAVEVTPDGQRYRPRTDLAGSIHHALVAAGVRPPSPVTLLGAAEPTRVSRRPACSAKGRRPSVT